MVLISSSGRAVSPRRRLALPVNQFPANRVVAVSGCRGEVPACFVEGKGQQISAHRLRVIDALTPLRCSAVLSLPDCGENLDAGVTGVDLEGHTVQCRPLQVAWRGRNIENLG